jgi:DNA (cytosine-5)-methyltransferase 1
MKTVTIADLFCGAGGTSTGAVQAIEALGRTASLTAVNHWDRAVATHTANHPEARHLCASVDSLNPRHLFREGELDILWASPECTHHSRARGGKPMLDQSRATAWCVTRWAEALRPSVVMVENVPEFEEWGPLGSNAQPLASRKGETFTAWVNTLRAIGYTVDWRILCAADYGDPTTRRRLFVQAVRGRRRIVWPEPTHSPETDLFGKARWRSARDIIDWNLPGESIYSRKKPLAPRTMERIWEGLRRFGVVPSMVCMEHGGRVVSIDSPVPTVTTARGGAIAVVEPFVVTMRGTNESQLRGSAKGVGEPLGTVSAGGIHHALIEPCLLPQQSDGRLRPVSEPAPTVSTAGAIALVEPFLVEYYGTGGAAAVDAPLNTVTTKARFGLVRPEVIVNGQRCRLDIRFRMLTAGELAGAQGFPTTYQFTGTKTEQVRQIGNAVPCGFARALVLAQLTQQADIQRFTASAACAA